MPRSAASVSAWGAMDCAANTPARREVFAEWELDVLGPTLDETLLPRRIEEPATATA